MRTLFAILCFSSAALFCFPQEVNAQRKSYNPMEKNINELTLGISEVLYYPYFVSDYDLYQYKYFGTINLTYSRLLSSRFAVTGTLAYAQHGNNGARSDDIIIDGGYYDYDPLHGDYYYYNKNRYHTSSIYLLAGFRFFYLMRPVVRLYMRVDMGLGTHIDIDRIGPYTLRNVHNTLSINYIPIGAQFGRRTAFTLEFGFGSTVCLLMAGISHRF